MGQIRKLDKEGMRSRIDKKNLSGSSWTCFKMADQTLTEIDGIVSNCSVGGITIPRYESLADSIGKLEADSKLLLDYPDELIEGIDTVDSDFSHNVNNALNALSAIKLDDIRVKNTFDVEVTSVFNTHDHTGDPLNSPKPDLTIADFIGYFDEYAWGRDTSFVKGFTDVLYLEDIREGKSLQDILKEDNDTLKELLYGSEIDIKKYAPNAQYMSEIAGDIPGGIYPLATAIYGYDIFTHDRLTKKERKNEGITGTVELVLLLLLWGKADGLVEGVTPYLSMAGSNVAQTGAEHLCEDMGAPPLATLLISSTVGALAFFGGEAAGMKSAEIINSQRGVFKGVDKNASFSEAKKLAGECKTSYGNSSSNITRLLDNYPELTGTNREKLLSVVQDSKLATYINEVYRPGASIGDGGTADALISEFYEGKSNHLLKAQERLKSINKIIDSGNLGLNDLDIAEAIRDDLEYAIGLFK